MISLVPKDSTKDKLIPLNFRDISLNSVVGELCSSVLNNRLGYYLENNHLLTKEQNGFRKNESCEGQVFSSYTRVVPVNRGLLL